MAVLPNPATTRAVLIGTSRYAHLEQIPAVANNLSALAAALCAPHSWGLAPEHCTVIEDPATAVEVLDAVRTAAEEATDTLLVYFAGHGLVEPRRGELFLGLTGSLPQHSYTGLPYGTLRDVVLDGRTSRQVVLLDCCFSGRGLGFMSPPGAEAVIDQVEVEGTYLLASVPDTSFALAPPGEPHTAFTGELLRLLRDGAPGGPELLDLDTVYAQVYTALRAKGRPLPQKRDRNTAGGLALARNVAWAPRGFGPPPPPYDHEPGPAPEPAPPPYEPPPAPSAYVPEPDPPWPLPDVPPKPAWSPTPLPSPAPAPSPRGASPGLRRTVRYGLVGALAVALIAAGIPLVLSWMKDSDASTDDSGQRKPKSSSTPKAGPTSGYNAATKGTVNASTKPGGTLRFVSSSDADSWDPQRSYYGFAWNFSRYYARQLVTYAPEPGKKGTELVPDLAEKRAKVTDGGKTYTYTLRDGLTWEDGTAITSKDIKYGIERTWAPEVITGGPVYLQQVLDPEHTYKGPYKDTSKDKLGLKAIRTPDDKTIVFRLPEPNGDFEQMLAMPAASPVKREKDTKDRYQNDPFSSGPYKFESYTPKKSLELVRNTEWNQSSDPIRSALPNRITVQINDNEQAKAQALLSGQYDLDLETTGLTGAGLIKARSRSDQLDDPHTGVILFAALPRSVKPLNNVHCRKAVIYAADRESMRTAAGGPQSGDIAPHMLPPSIEGSAPSYDPYKTLEDKGKPKTSEAKEELAACGKRDGFTTTIAARDQPVDVNVATALSESLKKVGIRTQVERMPIDDFYAATGSPATVKKKGYGIVIRRWSADFPTGQSLLQPLADSRFIQPAGNFNVAELDDPTVDDLFDAAIAEQDPAKAGSDYARINEKISDSAAYLPILFQRTVIWRGSRLTNVHTSEPWGGGYDYASLGVDE